MQTAAVIIPARLGSTRLPNKALLVLKNKPMIIHVCERARAAAGVSRVIVATDSELIAQEVRQAGFVATLVTEPCESGTDRVAIAARDCPESIILNLQGDEPFMEPTAIAEAIAIVARGEAKVGTCMAAFTSIADMRDPAQVKCVVDDAGYALYFSRALIPYAQAPAQSESLLAAPNVGRHLGLYSYTRDFLLEFTKLKPSFLEQTEALEQLRMLQYGHRIRVARVNSDAFGINTPEEWNRAQKFADKNF